MNNTTLTERQQRLPVTGFFSWWTSISRAERIVMSSLLAGSIVAIVNSTVWAIAVAVARKAVFKREAGRVSK